MQIIISTGFNNGNRPDRGQVFGIDRPLSIDFIQYRYGIWKDYTLKSMLNQKDTDWIWAIKLHQKTKKLTKGFFSKWDERIIECYGEEQQKAVLRRYDDVLIIRLDSDDLYRNDAVKLYRKAATKNNNEFFLCMEGFMYDIDNNTMARYDPSTSTPFHARRVHGQTHPKMGINMQHRRIKFNKPYIMDKNLYIVTVHNQNTSSRMQLATGDVEQRKCSRILKNFGVE